MSNFAKLFESETYGQIAVIKQTNDDGDPEIRFYFQPPGLGVCSNALSFGDGNEDESFDLQDKAWELVTLEASESIAKSVFDMLSERGLSTED